MGTTLTGTTPQDTYDSLIKVTDNGPLGPTTAKYLSDGLGNDSVLALSQAAVGIGTATPSQKLSVSGGNLLVNNGTSPDSNSGIRIVAPISTTHYNWMIAAQQNISGGFELTPSSAVGGTTFGTPALSILGASGNVGIGTSTPLAKLNVADAALSTLAITATGEATDQKNWVYQYGAAVGAGTFRLRAGNDALTDGQNAVIITRTGFNVDTHQFLTSGSERLRITSAGVLELAQGQIKFPATQVASADANTLDDYEEGTWTMGISFGDASVGVTYLTQVGSYTKIGRQVTATGRVYLTNKGSSAGIAEITGLPFTVLNNNGSFSAASLRLDNVTFANAFMGHAPLNTTKITLEEITEAGAFTTLNEGNFNNDSSIMVSLTYFTA